MAGLRFTELQSRSLEFLDFTSVTLDEFQQLVPPFEAVFQARMAADRGACHRASVPPVMCIGKKKGQPFPLRDSLTPFRFCPLCTSSYVQMPYHGRTLLS